MIAKPVKTPIISFNNNTTPRETPSEKRPHFTQTGEYQFPGTWR